MTTSNANSTRRTGIAIASASLFVAAAAVAFFTNPPNSSVGTVAPVAAPAVVAAAPAVDPAVEAMKQCAHDLMVERQRWFFDETGMTTTLRSGAAQSYADHMAAAGLETKTPIPFRLCG